MAWSLLILEDLDPSLDEPPILGVSHQDQRLSTHRRYEEPDFIASLDDEQAVNDCRVLVDLMRRVSGHEPRMWNVGTIGFGAYHYTYDSGREGDCQTIGFYPRKGKTTIYLMDGTARHSELLARLGKHTTSRVCVYVKRLADIDLKILEQILRQSYEYITLQDGRMGRVVS